MHAAAPGVRHSLGAYRSSLHECDSGFSKDTAPTDFDVLGVILSQFADQNATLHVVSGHLRDGGVLARPAHAFTHDGLRAIVEHKDSSGGA